MSWHQTAYSRSLIHNKTWGTDVFFKNILWWHSLFISIYLCIRLCHVACSILVPRPGTELMSPSFGAWLNHWTTKEVCRQVCFETLKFRFLERKPCTYSTCCLMSTAGLKATAHSQCADKLIFLLRKGEQRL